MSDRKKAIEGLEICIKNIDKVDCPNDCPYYSDCTKYENRYVFQPLLRDVLSLLKEQEAKPVELHTNAYGTKFYFCPKCKRELFHTRSLNFCERCGQAVKWD